MLLILCLSTLVCRICAAKNIPENRERLRRRNWFVTSCSLLSLISERIPPFTAGANRVRSVTQPPSVARPEPPPKPLSRPQTCVSIGLRQNSIANERGMWAASTHVCGAREARLMAFGRQGVNRADTEPRGSTDWVSGRLKKSTAMTRFRMGAPVTAPQDAPG